MGLPKFFFDNRLADAAIAASSTAAGNYNAANVADLRPYTWWKPSAMLATLTVDCGSAKPADFGAIYGQGDKAQFRASNDNFAINNSGTAQAAAAASLTLPAGASSVTDYYAGMTARILSGAGGEQERTVLTSRQNRSSYSQAFNSWTKVACTVNTDASLAPDGSLTADDLVEDLTSSSRYIYLTYTCIGGFNTVSVHAKQKTGSRCIQLRPSGLGTGIAYANFDLTNGVVGTTGGSSIVSTSMTSLGNGWYRCSLTWNNGGIPGGGHVGMVPLPTSSEVYSYTGDGTSAISVWGHQHEDGALATSYIRTATLAATGIGVAQWSSNYGPYSQAFNSWTKVACTVNTDASLAPDGSLTADDLVEDLTSSSRYIYLTYTCIGGFNTVSVHAKQKTGSRCIQLRPNGLGTGIAYANFDLTNGVVGTTGGSSIVSTSMTSLGNGWYRCSLTWNNAGIPAGGIVTMVPLSTSPETNNYTGDGASAISIWGHQHESGSVVTPYIATTSAAIALPDSTSVYEIMSSDVLLGEVHPSTNGLYLSEFAAVSYRYYRVRFPGATVPTIAMALIGSAFVMPKFLSSGYDPVGRTVIGQTNNNENGQPLGKIIDYEQRKQTMQYANVTYSWLRNSWDPAWKSDLRGSPALFAWDSVNYPAEIDLLTIGDGYAAPHKQGGLADLSFDVMGVAT